MTSARDDFEQVLRVVVVEPGERGLRGWTKCEIGSNLFFTTEKLETYCLAAWDPVVFDAFVLTAAVEFCDRMLKRRAYHWGRAFELRVPVHDVQHWNSAAVGEALHAALQLLTGDRWSISFYKRARKAEPPAQQHFTMPTGALSIIPYSEGLDSRIVSGLMAKRLGDHLIRVRLGSKGAVNEGAGRRLPFTSVPYRVKAGNRRFSETTARSRGFKFFMLSGIAATLALAKTVIVPESGQGALGPTLVVVGQAYEDYRNHPLFAARMEQFLHALLGRVVHFEFPRLWHTKGETLQAYVEQYNGTAEWATTWSCWQSARQVSVDGEKRQCGICAACMLRRLSIHTAGLSEEETTYIWQDLTVDEFERGAAAGFDKITNAQREYAIAGTLHLDHLAGLTASKAHAAPLALSAFRLSQALGIDESEAARKLKRLLTQHANEWRSYVLALGTRSFVHRWTVTS